MISMWKDEVICCAEVDASGDGDFIFVPIAYMHSEADFLIVEADDSFDELPAGLYTVESDTGTILREATEEDIDILLERIHG